MDGRARARIFSPNQIGKKWDADWVTGIEMVGDEEGAHRLPMNVLKCQIA